MFSFVRPLLLAVLCLIACGDPAGPAGSPLDDVKPTDCTLTATVSETLVSGTKVGTATGTLTCPRGAQLDLTVCLQSSMTSAFTDAMCTNGSASATMTLTRTSEASFAGTRNVRAVARGLVNGAATGEKVSSVITIVR